MKLLHLLGIQFKWLEKLGQKIVVEMFVWTSKPAILLLWYCFKSFVKIAVSATSYEGIARDHLET